jgi:hypothetical protein
MAVQSLPPAIGMALLIISAAKAAQSPGEYRKNVLAKKKKWLPDYSGGLKTCSFQLFLFWA